MMRKVTVLGGSGMLGSMVADCLSRDPDLKVTATVRGEALAAKCRERLPGVDWVLFDAADPDLPKALGFIKGQDWLINAIGITKPLVHDDNAAEVERAIRINSILPFNIARGVMKGGTSVIQIATDCVFSGARGGYTESDAHDALDVYGKTKSLGEVALPRMYHLRCSIVGPEPREHKFLLDWFLGQPRKASVNGFVNHRWNGVTTLHFARLCRGVITRNVALPNLQHVVPGGGVSKYELLQSFARCFHREDVSITPLEADTASDRTLKTNNDKINQKLWQAAGYASPPSIPEMVEELARFDYRLGGL